jgi:hypothetical protein
MCLDLDAFVQGHDARGQIVIIHFAKPCLVHHLFQGFLVWVHADAFCQVAVTRFVVGDLFAKFGQQFK